MQTLNESCDKQILKNVLDICVSKTLQSIGNDFDNLYCEKLIIIRYFQILKNPYTTFEFQANQIYDFHKFYENLEKADK